MEKMFYVLERIFRMTHIPIHYFDKSGEITLLVLGFEQGADPFVSDPELRKRILGKSDRGGVPTLDFEDDMLCGMCQDTIGSYVVLGPVCRNKPDNDRLRAYANRHGLLSKNLHIHCRTLDEVCAALGMVYYEITGEYITEEEIIFTKQNREICKERTESIYQAYELQYTEQEAARHNFSDELNYMGLVKNGDVEGVKRMVTASLSTFNDYSVGTLAQKAFKQHEYMACSLIVLASRAAIDGGLDSLSSYLLSDLYLQRLERCMDITDIHKLTLDVLLDYTERVKQKQEKQSRISYIEQSKNFIATHLNKRFTVEELAKEVGIDRSYLSKRFSQAEGIGIQQYTRKKRIEAAANMLKFSNESILAISNYLCFVSQSHFGKVFKEYMGQTPQRYRDSNKLEDFK